MIGRILFVDFRRAFRRTFWLSIALTFLIQLQGLSEYATWLVNWLGDVSVLEYLHFSFDTGTFQLVMPSVAALVYAASYLSDRQSGFLRYELLRAGRSTGYLLSKILTTYIAAFCAVFIGILLFAAFLRTRMPFEPTRYPEDAAIYACGRLMREGKSVLYMLCSIFFRAAAAGSWALFSLMISTMTRNAFAVYALPTISFYALNGMMSSMGLGTFSRIENGIMTPGAPIADFAYTYGVLLLFALVWAMVFFLRARKQVRT